VGASAAAGGGEVGTLDLAATRSIGMFFFEKKNQKTFIYSDSGRSHGARKKVFCFFFSKKKNFP
jgi:hypothetical protein